ncbi:MAG: phosphatase PAP2 family protein [Bacteroidetes bacterium]|nr:phosphatase PAP2 family protein [Bacteroidota bacterium]
MSLFIALIICCFQGSGQPSDSSALHRGRIKRYHVNYWVTGSIIGVGMASDYFAIGRLKSKPTITPEELTFINSDQQINLINSIDRVALKQNIAQRSLYTSISDYGEIGIFLLPALLIIDKNMRRDWLDLLLMYVEGHTITFSMYNYSPLGPTFQNRCRPFVYYPELTADERMNDNNSRNSFFSGHVGSCTYSTFFMAKVYSDYHPELGAKKYLLYLAASIPPLVIGYARVRSLAHFPSDVAVGFGLGAIIGIVVPELHKNRHFRDFSLGMSTSPETVGLSVRWKLDNRSLRNVSN